MSQPTPSHPHVSRRSLLQQLAFTAGAVAPAAALMAQSDCHAAPPRRKPPTPPPRKHPTPPPRRRLPSLYPGWNRRNFEEIQFDENSHVQFLVQALGSAARPMPSFRNLEQRDVVSFAIVSRALENTGVGAYLGAAPILNSRGYLAAAGSILTVEARHAGYLDTLLNRQIVPDGEPRDIPLTQAEVLAAAGSFFAGLNGGPPLAFSTTPSDANDIAILNFALALEFLEAEFYNINVPKFRGFL